MGIALRGTPQSNTSASGNSVVVNKPAGVQIGDLIVIGITSYGNIRLPSVGNTPSGFTFMARAANADSSQHCVARDEYWRIADGSEPSSWTLTNTGGDAACDGDVTAFSGVSTSTPFHIAAVTNQAVPDATPTCSDLGSTTVDGAWHILSFASWNTQSGAITGYTQDLLYGGGSTGTWHKAISPAGATGAKTQTQAADGWATVTFALNPAPAVAPGGPALRFRRWPQPAPRY